jgi:hypothetical protein
MVYIFWFGVVWTDAWVHQLLGVLGLGATNPHRILEVGSQIGSFPSWQGGKIWFFGRVWEEQQQGQAKIGETTSERGMHFHDFRWLSLSC